LDLVPIHLGGMKQTVHAIKVRKLTMKTMKKHEGKTVKKSLPVFLPDNLREEALLHGPSFMRFMSSR
jgi:hypothetical protein